VQGIEQIIYNIVNSAYLHMQWPGVVLLMAVESACIPFPSEVIMPLAGWMLIKNQSLPVYYVFIAGGFGALGNTLGSALAYGVGAWGGRPFLNRWGKYILISHHDLDSADRFFTKWGSRSIFIGRLLPVVRTFISLPAGISRMNFPKFLLYTFIGSFIFSVPFAYLGYRVGEYWEQISAAVRPFDYVIIAVVVVLIGLYVYRHVRHVKAGTKTATEQDR
jgi:membrane protein DedA with SNARE-associated domain